MRKGIPLKPQRKSVMENKIAKYIRLIISGRGVESATSVVIRGETSTIRYSLDYSYGFQWDNVFIYSTVSNRPN